VVVTLRQESASAVRYTVPRWSPAWAIPEVPVSESQLHDQAIEYVRALLLAWAARSGRRITVLRNIGIRWFPPEPRAGFDPDLCVLDPAPEAPEGLSSLRLWEPGLAPPVLALEVVSPGHPYKDYIDTPDRAAACGVGELWVYDPLLAGPKGHGGPFALQVWRRQGESFARVHAGEGPAYSEALGAWLHPRVSRIPAEAQLCLSDAQGGEPFWPTLLEHERHGAEQRAAAAERELAELRAKLAR
jgi:Uma2 family endonuclease